MSLAVLALLASPADACGGMFCNNAQPTMQAAERIAFAIDEAAGEVEAHVQITYTGESKDFAWIVPVSGEPELFLSTDDLFAALYFPTNPAFSTTMRVDGECKSESRGGIFQNESALSDAGGSSTDFDSTGTVNVVSQKAVGPYETVTLEAGTSEGLLNWLQENGYDLPDNLGPALDPYVSDGMSFVALRLKPDSTTGDIAPLGMRYAGTKASVPIQLTSIAAVPDTRLEVYVFAKARVVPESYLHVIPNDMAYDWFQQTVVYDDIVTLAANEAGGHAFATDFAGETASLRGLVWNTSTLDMEQLRTQAPVSWMQEVMDAAAQTAGSGGGYYSYSNALSDPNLTAVLREVLPLPAHLVNQTTEINWWSCLECYPAELEDLQWDANAATTALSLGWVEPLERAEALIASYPHISRLTSSLDALEMTVDPVFVVNEDMAQSVSPTHTATLVYDCASRRTTFGEAPRQLIFPDGTAVDLPSEQWFADNGTTEYAYLQDLAAINAAVIEKTGASGDAQPVSDQRGALAEIVARLNASFADEFGKGGCGCDGGAGAPVMPLGVLAATLLLRRRKRA